VKIGITQELWKKVKKFIPDSPKSTINDLTCEDGTTVNDSKSIANKFNDFFVNIGFKLASKFTPSCTSRINVKSPASSFHFKPFTLNKVNKILNSLSISKASGLDGISVRLLKEGSPALADKLLHIFNLSISTGSVPKVWKIKRVSPIFKSGNKDEAGNYRPVSVASIITHEIFEKLVYEQMMTFILGNKILHSNQSGFRSGFSTSSAALDVKEHIISCLKENKFVCAVLIDLSKD
jgi:hypothetical protein